MLLLFGDTETTGLDKNENDIIQFAGIAERDGVEVGEFNIRMQPKNYAKIQKEALEVNKITIAQLKTFMPAKEGFDKILYELNKINYSSGSYEKAVMVGCNAKFDTDMLCGAFDKYNAGHLMRYIDMRSTLDITAICRGLKHFGIIDVFDCKLGTLAEYFGVNLENAHDAMADVRATMEIYKILKTNYFDKMEKFKK